ncbi:hypothetical protein DL96DRAFT_1563412 [Flagelloscypha sp. PMI_526]|nr:hypothetical protein DL96DRAFT_1563412 [Flagelloscypha sp. PMI_526]
MPPAKPKPNTRGNAAPASLTESDTETDETAPGPAKLRKTDVGADKSSAGEPRSRLGTLIKTDLAQIVPLKSNGTLCFSDVDNKFPVGSVMAARHLSETPYFRFANFEEAQGTLGVLHNLALADPAMFKERSGFVHHTNFDGITRFFLCGFCTERSNTRTNDEDETGGGSRRLCFFPSERGFIRALEVLRAIFDQNPVYIQAYHATITISGRRQVAAGSRSPQKARMGADPRPSPSKRKRQDDPSVLSYPVSGVLAAGEDIPVYDGRHLPSFDINAYKHLPRVSEEIELETALIAVFTLGKFMKNGKSFISFNAQDFILLSNPESMEDINDYAGSKELPSFDDLND